ncbi:MAG: class I tRNA ligase family protein, partial [Treponemataceae bacterium]|nr:class I tRNA ligase family protein [Treponemataceae bacterium]
KPMADIDITGKLDDKALISARKTFAQTIKKVTDDTASLNFNTAISQMMIFINEVSKLPEVPKAMWSDFVKVLSPYAPHLGEELWEKLGNKETIAYVQWPTYNEEFTKDNSCTIVVQVNGKIRDKLEMPMNTDKAEIEKAALATEGAKKFLEGKTPLKVIVVPNKLVNIVVK